jgi:hypothetical protein
MRGRGRENGQRPEEVGEQAREKTSEKRQQRKTSERGREARERAKRRNVEPKWRGGVGARVEQDASNRRATTGGEDLRRMSVDGEVYRAEGSWREEVGRKSEREEKQAECAS